MFDDLMELFERRQRPTQYGQIHRPSGLRGLLGRLVDSDDDGSQRRHYDDRAGDTRRSSHDDERDDERDDDRSPRRDDHQYRERHRRDAFSDVD